MLNAQHTLSHDLSTILQVRKQPPPSHLTCPRSQIGAPQTLACEPVLWGLVQVQIPIQSSLPFPQAEGLPTPLLPAPTEGSHQVSGSRRGVVIGTWPDVVGLHSPRSCSFTTKDSLQALQGFRREACSLLVPSLGEAAVADCSPPPLDKRASS